MDEKSLKNRIKAVRKNLRANKLDSLIVINPGNVTYLTGFAGDDSWALITTRSTYLITDSRYTEQARKECINCRIVERKKTIVEATAKIIGTVKSIKAVGIEDGCTVSIFEQFRKKFKLKLRPVAGLIDPVRCIKDTNEAKAISTAAKIAWQALDETLAETKSGMSENAMAGLLEFNIRKLNSQVSFPTIIAFGPNGSRPHHQPGKRILKQNDIILIDFGAKYKGYCCDITRCFVMGDVKKVVKGYEKAYYAVLDAQQAAIKKVRPGIKLAEVDAAAKEVLAPYGQGVYKHGIGHSLGLNVHDPAATADKERFILKVGQILTVEPGLYIPGKLGIRIEDDILVTETGPKILTAGKKFAIDPSKLPIITNIPFRVEKC